MAEIVPGHGRWTEHLLARAAYVTIVDVNQKCLDACAERFADEAAEGRLTPMLTRGSTLPSVAGQLADFVWSFDSFVHMDPEVVQGYLGEIARVLRPGGHAVIHHAGLRGWSLPLVVATRRLGRPGHIVQRLAGQGRWRDSGNRSPVSRDSVLHWALDAGLAVDRQPRPGATRTSSTCASTATASPCCAPLIPDRTSAPGQPSDPAVGGPPAQG